MTDIQKRIEYYTHNMNAWTTREQGIVDCLKDVVQELTAREAKAVKALEGMCKAYKALHEMTGQGDCKSECSRYFHAKYTLEQLKEK